MFKHLDYLKEEVDLEAEMIEGTRFYRVPSGKMYPSITSVTSFYGRQKFVEWRKKVGNEEAIESLVSPLLEELNFTILLRSICSMRTWMITNLYPLQNFFFLKLKPYLDRINNIHALEKSLYSDYLGLAGRVDCIAEYEGELAIIDFKTSKKIKPEKWIENYFVQEVAYACMYYEMTGIPVQKLITIMVAENGECFVYEKRNKDYYIKLLTKYIREFVSHHTED